MNTYSEVEDDYSLLVEKPLDIASVFRRYLSYWKWFLLSVIICIGIALAYIVLTLPKYEVTTSILFKDDLRGGTSEVNINRELGVVSQRNNADNEVEVLKKSLVVEEVVRKLGLYASQIEIKPLIDALPITSRKARVLYANESPITVTMSDEHLNGLVKSPTFYVQVKPAGGYEIYGKYKRKKFQATLAATDSAAILPFGKVEIKRTNLQLPEEMKILVQLQHPSSVASGYLNNLEIELTSKTSSVADITLICSNGNLGTDFLREYIETYNANGINYQLDLANRTSQVIDDHLAQLSTELSAAEDQVQSYRQSQGLTDIGSQVEMYNSQMATLGQRRMDVESQYSIISSLNSHVQQKNNHNELLPNNSGINSPALVEQINNYNDLVLERNKLSRIASNSNQSMIELNNKIESTFNSVRSGLQNEKNNLEIQQRDISSMYNQNSARIRAIPRQERVYSDIRRGQGAKESLFLYLLQKKEERYMNMVSIVPDSKLIDNIRVMGVSWPNPKLIGIFFLALGLFMPIVIIKIGDLLRFKISNKEELENLTSIPVLGEIPKTGKVDGIAIKDNGNDSFNEMVRLLRANLMFVADGKENKVMNILSSISGEGKSFVSMNLAMSLALLEKKVLLIELDIRRPKFAEKFGLEKDKGITNYLSGSLGKEEIIRESGVHPNLSVITAGAIPPNPNELLAKPLLDELINSLRDEFDFILIDTAPIGVVSDAFLINRIADANLYIVRSGYTPKKYIEDATKHFQNNKLKKMYFILNSVNLKASAYQYGYGKKMEYGYS